MQRLKAIAALQSLDAFIYAMMMCLSYLAYEHDGISIEPLIQGFVVNLAMEKITCYGLMSNEASEDTKSTLRISLALVAASILLMSTFFNTASVILVFGLLCGIAQGGLSAIHKTVIHRTTEDRVASVVQIRLVRLVSLLATLGLLAAALQAGKARVMQYQTSMLLAFVVECGLTTYALVTSDTSSLRIFRKDVSVAVQERPRIVNIHTYAFSFVLAVLSYYDIILPFIVLYTNHINTREHIHLHEITWIQFDSVTTTFLVTAVYKWLVAFSEVTCEALLKFLPQKASCVLFYAMTVVKIGCVVIMPISSLVSGSIIVAALASGTQPLARAIPSLNTHVDNKCNAISSVLLFVIMTAGGHIDNETLSISMTVSISVIALFLTIVVMILTLTNMTVDTRFVNLIVSKAGCFIQPQQQQQQQVVSRSPSPSILPF